MWIVLAIVAAISQSLQGAVSRRILREVDTVSSGHLHAGGLLMLTVQTMTAALAMTPVLLVVGVPEVSPGFWATISQMFALGMIGQMASLAALSVEELSVTSPLQATWPVWTAVAGWFLLHEKLTTLGWIGIVLITAGYAWFTLTKAVRRPRSLAVALILLAGISYGVVNAQNKTAILLSSPFLFGVVYLWIIGALYAILTLIWVLSHPAQRSAFRHVASRPRLVAGTCGFALIQYAASYIALVTAPVGYFFAIKSLKTFGDVVAGKTWLHEQDAFKRIVPTIVMLCGAILIIIAG